MAESESSELLDVSPYEGGNMLNSEIFRTTDVRRQSANLGMREWKAFWQRYSLEQWPCRFWFHVPTDDEREEVIDIIETLELTESIHETLLLPKSWKKQNLSSVLESWEKWYYLSRNPNNDWTANVFAPSENTPSILQIAIRNAISVRWFRNRPVVPTTAWDKMGWSWRLPQNYQELSYIESDWYAYINTWILAKDMVKIELEASDFAQWSQYADSYSYVVFWTTASSWRCSSTYYTYNWSRFRYHIWAAARDYHDCSWFQTGNVNKITYNWASWFTVDNYTSVRQWSDSTRSDASNSPICFWYCWNWSNHSYSKYKMYSLCITTSNGTYTYVPCARVSDWEVWLYCLETKTFVTNSWTWSFTSWTPVAPYVKRKPWENTTAYYKLDSVSSTSDLSWNWHNLTNQNWVTFWDFDWVDCAFFNNNSSSETWVWLYTTDFWMSTNMTVSMWFYAISFPHVHLCQFQFWNWTRWQVLWTWINNSNWNRAAAIGARQNWAETITSWMPVFEWRWHYLNVTKEGNNYVMYIDNVQVATLSANLSVPNKFWLWQQDCDESDLYWYISNVIVENKKWTKAQRETYYAQTRNIYYPDSMLVPTASTSVYYPMWVKSTVWDYWYYRRDLNVNRNITFMDYNWVKCAYSNPSNSKSALYYTPNVQIIPNSSFTRRCWLYYNGTSTDNPRLCSSYLWNPYWILVNNSWTMVCWTASNSEWVDLRVWWWHLYTITWSFSSWRFKAYLDWELVNTWTWGWYNNGYWLTIFWHDSDWSSSATSDKFNWYASEYMLENREWSTREIKKDYLDTKKYYLA